MRVDIQGTAMAGLPAVRRHAEQRALFELARYGDSIQVVRLRVTERPPTSEHRYHCGVAVTVWHDDGTSRHALARAEGDDIFRLIDGVLARAASLVGGEIERALVRREREIDVVQRRIAEDIERQRFVVRSPAMRAVVELASRVAPLDTTVLVTGESGTGKEFVVRLMHEHSARAKGPLVSVNCAALTETLLESELFGHVRGAFTGAVRDKPGLFEVAADGTLFLDEVGEIAPTLQAKLLRALQEGEIRRVGGERSIRVRPRIIAATNRDLRVRVADGGFREDLYFRLAAFVISLPPLRDRPEDVPALVHEFLGRSNERLEKNVKTITPQAMTALVSYGWPGNVRELEHAVERAVILARTSALRLEDLPGEVVSGTRDERVTPASDLDVHAHERALVAEALRRFGGNKTRAARALGVSTVTLWRMLKRGISPS